MNTANSKTHKYAKNILMIALLFAGTVLISFALVVANNTNKIQHVWDDFETTRSEKVLHLLDLNTALGYGGLIHQLKDYILRADEQDHNHFHENLGKALASTQHYLEQKIDEEERAALVNISKTLHEYGDAITLIENLHLGSTTPQEINKAVDIPGSLIVVPADELDRLSRIDDQPLIDALNLLNNKLWHSLNNEQSRSKAMLLARFRSAIGYDGIIHHFKDYVLHGDPKLVEKTDADLQQAFQLLHKYGNLPLTTQEQTAIQRLKQLLNTYHEALRQAIQLHRQNLSSRQIDAAMPIDNGNAMQAMLTLAHAITNENSLRTQQVQVELNEIRSLSHIGVFVTTIAVILLLIINIWTQRDQRQYERNISQAERRLGAILDNTADAIIVTNEQGIITEFNHAAEKMFGYDAQEIIGKNVSSIMPKQYGDKHDQYIQRYRQLGVAKIIGIGRETTAQHKSGREFPVMLSIGKSKVNNEVAFTGIVRDITEDYDMRKDLIAAKEHAEEASKAKSQFLASMSHELRTPLNAIIGLSQLLVTDPDLPHTKQSKEALEDIHASGRHLLSLVNDVLDYAKIESDKLSLQIEQVSPTDCLLSAIAMTQPQAEKYNIKIEQHFDTDLPVICADALRVRQILLNFLSNAVKYNTPGGTVNIYVNRHAQMLRFSISDTGKGIIEDKQKELFTPFKRLGEEGGNIEGTGIGLSISKTLIEQMEGNIGFLSSQGKGSTFWFELPLAESKQQHS